MYTITVGLQDRNLNELLNDAGELIVTYMKNVEKMSKTIT
jgi:hypothetical protein